MSYKTKHTNYNEVPKWFDDLLGNFTARCLKGNVPPDFIAPMREHLIGAISDTNTTDVNMAYNEEPKNKIKKVAQ